MELLLIKNRTNEVIQRVHIDNIEIENNRFIVNGEFVVKSKDFIIYKCNKCYLEVKERFSYRKKFMDKNFICKSCLRKSTNLEKYGVEYITKRKETIENRKNNFKKKHGVDHPMKLDSVKEKIIETNLKKYGVEHASSSKWFRDKVRKTSLEKYGVSNVSKSNAVKKKISENRFKNFLNNIENRVPDYEALFDKYHGQDSKYKWKCKKCENIFEDNILNGSMPKCPKCYPFYRSVGEQEVSDFLAIYFNDITNNKKIKSQYDIDIYIPSKNIAIEYNGLYWHSELFKDDAYHLNKAKFFESIGITVINIFEDEWLYKREIVMSRLASILKIDNFFNRIHARDTVIKEISPKLKNQFLDSNHLQGCDRSNINIGAFCNGELIGVMTFSKPRVALGNKTKEPGVYEMSRFALKSGIHSPGIASKLLTSFERKYSPARIYTFADKRWSSGNLYINLGFNYLYESKPNYWYFSKTDRKRYHRFKYRKDVLTKMNGSGNTEREMANSLKLYRIYDCGNIKFEKLYSAPKAAL